MLSLKKIVEAIQQCSEKYSRTTSEEHITALIELYATEKTKELKKIAVNQVKDLLEKPDVSREDLRQLIDDILSIEA